MFPHLKVEAAMTFLFIRIFSSKCHGDVSTVESQEAAMTSRTYQNISEGMAIILVKLSNNRYLLGAEGRRTYNSMKGKIIVSDKIIKIREVADGIVITWCGNACRSEAIRDYIMACVRTRLVPNGVYSVLDYIEEFISMNPVDHWDHVPSLMFVVGNSSRMCLAFRAGDLEGSAMSRLAVGDSTWWELIRDRYAIMGSGQYYAARKFTSIWDVTNDGAREFPAPTCGRHALDIAIELGDLGYMFNPNQVFFMHQAPYECVNYKELQKSLEDSSYDDVPEPLCLGHIRGEWKLFVVDFGTRAALESYFDSAKRMWTIEDSNGHPFQFGEIDFPFLSPHGNGYDLQSGG
ncbi:hypothetical protein OROMI_027036 [Orobanche minor]